ncbi:MAG: Crp/Fnr family transcriptional regulator [Flavobacterium sp.]|nr:Crp/Fnr family transcriptional regulator [Flavobacterium sp.]MCU0393917.1 Crp/Fnr family transcriptional regulator [Thermoflexibacter sp.]
MNQKEVIETISRLHHRITDSCKTELCDASHLVFVEKNTILASDGQVSNKIFYMVSGAARAFYLKEGKDITDWFAFENSFICAIDSFFGGLPSAHYIETLEPSLILELSKSKVDVLCDKHADFERLNKLIITQTLLSLQQRIVSIQFENAQQKYDNLLLIRPDITQRVPLTHIASYLGISLETLSRIRNPKNRI